MLSLCQRVSSASKPITMSREAIRLIQIALSRFARPTAVPASTLSYKVAIALRRGITAVHDLLLSRLIILPDEPTYALGRRQVPLAAQLTKIRLPPALQPENRGGIQRIALR